MASDLWVAYAPDRQLPWNLARVVHLHRRAGFAGTWGELQRDLKAGPEKSIQRLLRGEANLHAPREYATTARLLVESAETRGTITLLQAAWFYRFLFSPHPLLEKLTLLWHDHFATANSKVDDVPLMRQQNDGLRKYALGKFGDLLCSAVREPALLLYLDAPNNRKGHANENLARELMELFTLGVGNYTEGDVKEAARALTGWSVEDGKFVEISQRHDPGEKTLLGQKARFSGTQLVNLLLKQPAVAERMVAKLVRLLFGEKGVSPDACKQLAEGLRQRDLDVKWAVETILKSRLFFAAENIRNRVLGPVEFIVGAVRALEHIDPAPSTLALADWSARMGQEVFNPPNVGGWPVGRRWIHSRSMIARANFAAALVEGGDGSALDPTGLAKKHGFEKHAEDVLVFHHQLLFGTDPEKGTKSTLLRLKPKQMVTALLSSPQAQLG